MALRRSVSTVLKGATYRGISTILGRIFDMFTIILLTRYILAEGYGIWSLSWTALGLVYTLFDILFLGESITAYVSRYRAQEEYDNIRRFTFYSFSWNFILSIVVYSITFFASEYIAHSYNAPQMSLLIKLLGLTYIIASIDGTYSRFLNAYKEFGKLETARIIGSISKFGFISFLLISGKGLVGAALGYIMHNLVSTFFLVYFAWKLLPRQKSNCNPYNFTTELRKALKYNIPIKISSIISLLSSNFLFLYLGLWTTTQLIGLVHAAAKLSKTAQGLTTSLVTGPLFPIMTEMYAKNRIRDVQKLTLLFLKHLLPLTALVSITTIAFAPEIMTITFGESFMQGSEFLQWLILLVVASAPSAIVHTLLLSTGNTNAILRISVASTVPTVIVMLWVIPNFQALGYSISSVILAFSVNLPLFIYYMRKTIGQIEIRWISIRNLIYSILPPSIFFIFSHLIISLTAMTVVLIAFICIVIYFLTACNVSYINRKELENFQTIIQGWLGNRMNVSWLFNLIYKLVRK